MSKTLNLGAGNVILADAVNHDLRRHRPEIDVVHNLDELPWPWADESFDHIVAESVFEHLRLTLVESLDECWRLLRPGGTLSIRIPWWRAETAYRDPTHRWRFSLKTLDLFDPDTEYGHAYGFYTERKWKILKGPQLSRHKTSITAVLQVRK